MASKKKAIIVKTHRYVAEHGKKPFGRKTWTFRVRGTEPFVIEGVYSEAKMRAVALARETNGNVLVVMP